MLLPSGPDMVRGLYCTGPEARQNNSKAASYGITVEDTSLTLPAAENARFASLFGGFRRLFRQVHVEVDANHILDRIHFPIVIDPIIPPIYLQIAFEPAVIIPQENNCDGHLDGSPVSF
jgi:hypothetical protein